MIIRQKIPIGNDYPYMYARVSARRAKLLERQDYEDMIKMQTNEIANRLEEGDYSEEIEELGASYSGAELIELAVNRNLAKTMAKLIEISPESLKRVLKAYLRRYDIETLKRILRWKLNGSEEDIGSLMMPVNSYTFEEIEEMLEKNYDELVDGISFRDSEIDYRKYLEEAEGPKEIEAALDRAYHEELRLLSKEVGSRQFSRFVRKETENENLRKILRLRKGGASEEQIRKRISEKTTKLVGKALEAQDYNETVEIVVGAGKTDQKDTLGEIEQSMKVKRLQKSLKMLHTEPLGITSILGYMVAKMIEAENLKVLAQARASGVEGDEIIDNLVIA